MPMRLSNGIAGELRGGDVVAILSNGGFGGIYEKLPARLRQRLRAERLRLKCSPDLRRNVRESSLVAELTDD